MVWPEIYLKSQSWRWWWWPFQAVEHSLLSDQATFRILKTNFTFADDLAPYFYIWNTNLVLTFIGGGNWCISKTCACWWHLGSGCLTDIILVINFSKTIVLVNEHEQSFGWDLEKFLLSSPDGGSRGWYGGWEESDRWRNEESGKDFFRECCNNNTLILCKNSSVWHPDIFWMIKTVPFFVRMTFQFCSTLGIAPFAAAPDTVVSVENITDQRWVQQKLPLHFIHYQQGTTFE